MSRERASRRFYRADSSHELRAFLDRGQAANQENRWTFEIAWEAANKGIIFFYYSMNELMFETESD